MLDTRPLTEDDLGTEANPLGELEIKILPRGPVVEIDGNEFDTLSPEAALVVLNKAYPDIFSPTSHANTLERASQEILAGKVTGNGIRLDTDPRSTPWVVSIETRKKSQQDANWQTRVFLDYRNNVDCGIRIEWVGKDTDSYSESLEINFYEPQTDNRPSNGKRITVTDKKTELLAYIYDKKSQRLFPHEIPLEEATKDTLLEAQLEDQVRIESIETTSEVIVIRYKTVEDESQEAREVRLPIKIRKTLI